MKLDATGGLKHTVGVPRRNLRKGVVLEHHDVADSLSVQVRRTRERVHHVTRLDTVGAAAGDDQLAKRRLAAVTLRVVWLGVTLGTWPGGAGVRLGHRLGDELGDGLGSRLRVLGPGGQLDAGVRLDRLHVALLARLVEGDRAAAATDPAGAADAMHVDVR